MLWKFVALKVQDINFEIIDVVSFFKKLFLWYMYNVLVKKWAFKRKSVFGMHKIHCQIQQSCFKTVPGLWKEFNELEIDWCWLVNFCVLLVTVKILFYIYRQNFVTSSWHWIIIAFMFKNDYLMIFFLFLHKSVLWFEFLSF